MAALTTGLTVLSVALNVALLGWMVWTRETAKREAKYAAMEEELRGKMAAVTQQPGDQAMLERVLERLLGAVVPEPREESRVDAPTTQHEAEYEEPVEPVLDWTDPFIGLERPVVGRLAPGQSIPGLESVTGDGSEVDAVTAWRESGEGAFDEWARDSMVPEGEVLEKQWESWVDPVRLDDE